MSISVSWGKKIKSLFQTQPKVETMSEQELERLLFESDLSGQLVEELMSKTQKYRKKGEAQVRDVLYAHTLSKIEPLMTPFVYDVPSVFLMIGINGSGKTTSTARLAKHIQSQGKDVVLAAGDTFRAGAIDQLQIWAERLGVTCVSSKYKADPASVIFEGWQTAKAQNAVLIADTAGRLHTQNPLMEQLLKIVRVLKKDPALSMQTLLVLDGTNGQNALIQSKAFSKDVDIDGLIMTKLDGSSKGGAVISSSLEMNLPIRFVGVGESEHDFVPFDHQVFLKSFYGLDDQV